jgi:hypothetical protein
MKFAKTIQSVSYIASGKEQLNQFWPWLHCSSFDGESYEA